MDQKTVFLYFHGFASSPHSNKARAFKKRFDELNLPLVIPDLENGDFLNLTITSQVEVIRKAFAEYPAERYAVIGSSMGGFLAALIAEQNLKVVSAYMMCPGFNFLKRWKNRLLEENPDWSEIPDLIPIFNYRYNKIMEFGSSIFEDAAKWEKAIGFKRNLPMRLVHGRHDNIVSVNESLAFVRSRPWATLEVLDSDHGLLSHTNWIIDDCLQFFKGQGLIT